jgi:hypothetical protein
MRATTLTLALVLVPAVLLGQATSGNPPADRTTATAAALVQANTKVQNGFSAEGRARLEATFQAALEKRLPTEPMADRMAEGQAKGANEAQIIAATQQTEAQLEASQQALIRAGRQRPSDEEVARGAQVIARGATSAQLEAFVRHAPSGRGLEVAFEVLTQLSARGVPVDQALTVIGAKLEAGASDGRLVSVLGSANAQAGLGLGVGLTRKP